MNGQNNPPTDVEPGDLFRKLLERPRPSEVIDFPAKTTNDTPIDQVRVCVLLDEQLDEATFLAKNYLKKRGLTDVELSSPWGEKLLGDAKAKELLAMAVVMVDPIKGSEDTRPVYPRLFRSGADVRKLTSDEITALFGAYILVQKRFGPSARELDDAEVNAWIMRLVVGASELPLHRLDLHQLAELCMSLARRSFTFSQLLVSQQQNSPFNSDSIPESWAFTTTSPTEQPASDTLSGEDEGPTITVQQAVDSAKRLFDGG